MMDLKGKKCLITGGAGFIGSHLADRLLSIGASVRVIDDLSNGRMDNISHNLGNRDFQFFKGSITDPFDAERAVEGIEMVWHLACLGVRHSLVHPYVNHKVNAEGTLLMLEASRKAGVKRFLYCSSSEVYGTAEFVPMTETHPTHPCTVYGAGKLAGEAYARAYFLTHGMYVVIIRPFNAYGPRSHHEGDSGEVIPKFIVRALNSEPLTVYGNGSQSRDFTFVTDTASAMAIALLSEGMKGRTLNVGTGAEIMINDLAAKVKTLTGSSSEIVHTPERPGDVLRLHADPGAFRSLCPWRPEVSLEDGIKQVIGFFRQHPLGLEELLRTEGGRSWEN